MTPTRTPVWWSPWVPTVITIGGLLLAWGAWKGGTQQQVSTICTRVDRLEAAASGYPQAYMPRNETEARLKGIEGKLDMVLAIVQRSER